MKRMLPQSQVCAAARATPPERKDTTPRVLARLAATLAVLASSAFAQLQFTDATAVRLPAGVHDTQAMALGDVDGDGDLDLVCGNFDQDDRLYLNDGQGTFTDATAGRMPANSESTVAVALGDVDGDLDLDLVFGSVNSSARLYLNDGQGSFAPVTGAGAPRGPISVVDVALGDVDGDLDLDLVLGGGYHIYLGTVEPDTLYLNDGQGRFTAIAGLPANSDPTSAVALDDVDLDGDLDLVRLHAGQTQLYLNDGQGTFTDATAARMPFDNGASSVVFGDVDGDLDPDLVLGSGQNRLYLNDGHGTFTDATAARMPIDNDWTVAVALGDVDLDGDVDLVCGNYAQQNRLYLNDGQGTFTDATAARMPIDNDPTTALALGDVDFDGDADLAWGSAAQNRLYLNLLRQLDVPLPVQLGQPYQLDVYARYGPPRNSDVAVLMLSTGTAHLPVPPFGIFGLDPTQLAVLPALPVPQPAGIASLSLPMPNAPLLVGLSIYAQAILVQDPIGIHLTNVTADRIAQ